jgi:hypothetical protein
MMSQDRKKIKREEKRLKFIREERNRRNEMKQKYGINPPVGSGKKFKNQKSKE